MSEYKTFTSESVGEGHPDKLADQISDAVLDGMLAQDPDSRVACETLVKDNLVVLAGEIRTTASVDVEAITREVIRQVGYTSQDSGINPETCTVMNALGMQSVDIALGVDETSEHEQGAGDQGLMFGYATNETDTYMPAPIYYAHQLVIAQAQARRKKLDFLRPDAKSQLTFRYDSNGKPSEISAVVLSTQHDPEVTTKNLEEAVMEEIIKPVLPHNWISNDTKIFINPTGKFVVGGPLGDCGLTGRKIIVDTYGGLARHGGGAFSGKDPSKVDRSAAYAGRYVAKNLVAAGVAERLEIQISYAIGVAEPTSISVNTFGTSKLLDENIIHLVREYFDLRPKGLIAMLNLKRPIYQKTAAYGHFGREEPEFAWEAIDKADEIKKAI